MTYTDRAMVEQEVVRLQVEVNRHPVPEAAALPWQLGVLGSMDLFADELQPAKHQDPSVVAAKGEASDDYNHSQDVSEADDGIPELELDEDDEPID